MSFLRAWRYATLLGHLLILRSTTHCLSATLPSNSHSKRLCNWPQSHDSTSCAELGLQVCLAGTLSSVPRTGKAARVVTLRPFSLPILWLCCFSDNKLLWKGPHCFSLPCPNWKNLKDGNQGVIGMSEPPMSALGVCPELTPPSGCFRPEQSAPLISVKGLVDPVGSDLDRSRIRWLLPSSLGGQVHF